MIEEWLLIHLPSGDGSYGTYILYLLVTNRYSMMFILDKADSTRFSSVCQPLDKKTDMVYNGFDT
jgi:hypothetical protein